jgi:hypothetical protein
MFGSETWTLRRTDERRLEAAEMLFLRYAEGKANKYTKGRKIGRKIYRGCHHRAVPSNFCVINR